MEVSGDNEIVSREGGDHAVPGKAVAVMDITDPGFKDFRTDASCIIRPQSLIGERYVDCTPTQPYAAGQTPPPEFPTIPDDQPGPASTYCCRRTTAQRSTSTWFRTSSACPSATGSG